MVITIGIVAVVCAVVAAVAIVQAVMLADQVNELTDERDRAVRDRDASARAFATRVLLEIADDLKRAAEKTKGDSAAAEANRFALASTADWIESLRVPMVTRGHAPAPKGAAL